MKGYIVRVENSRGIEQLMLITNCFDIDGVIELLPLGDKRTEDAIAITSNDLTLGFVEKELLTIEIHARKA